MPPPASPCRSTATSTAAWRTRRSPLRGAGRRASRAGSAPSRPHPGSAPQFITFASLAGAGDHIVASAEPLRRLDHPARRDAAPLRRRDHLRPLLGSGRLRGRDHRQDEAVFAETIANPSGEIADVEGLADGRARRHMPLIDRLDRRHPLPEPPDRVGRRRRHPLGDEVPRRPRHHARRRRRRVRPLPLGTASTSRCSTSRCRTYGGLNWHGNFGEYAFLTRLRAEQLRDIGPTLAPHSAFLLAQGVETLPFRMQAHVDNARVVAEWLRGRPAIEFVQLGGPARPSRTTSARRSTCRRGRDRCSASG